MWLKTIHNSPLRVTSIPLYSVLHRFFPAEELCTDSVRNVQIKYSCAPMVNASKILKRPLSRVVFSQQQAAATPPLQWGNWCHRTSATASSRPTTRASHVNVRLAGEEDVSVAFNKFVSTHGCANTFSVMCSTVCCCCSCCYLFFFS